VARPKGARTRAVYRIWGGGGSDYVTHGNTFGDHNVEASNIVPIVMLKPFAPLQSAGTMILVSPY
ncbi:MAG: hypothetical protein OXC67_02290, partial [Flavobacteriaceae bacterium]|nr:hypothetical protein [Flavobacteriaceae bacterium]